MAPSQREATTSLPTRPDPAAQHSARVVIIEHHRLLVDGLRAAMRAAGFAVEAVEVDGRSPGDIVEAALGSRPQVVLLALDLGGGTDGAELVGPLRAAGARVLVVTGVEDRSRHDRAVALGAQAVLPKVTRLADTLVAVRRAAAGIDVMSPAERSACRRRDALASPARRRELQGLGLLSPGEARVLAGLVEGRSVGEIATLRGVRLSTVRAQVRSVLVKLGVSSQLQAVALAHRRSWRPPRHDG